MKIITSLLLFALLGSSGGCSHFSKSNRQQRAYAQYVRKTSGKRVHQQQKFRNAKPQMPVTPPAGEAVESSQTGPQSVSSGEH